MSDQPDLRRSRDALETGKCLPTDEVPHQVAHSWERCRNAGLDPRARANERVLPSSDVVHRREANASLRGLALAEMQTLYSQIAGSNFMIALADSDAIVLDTISDQHFAESSAGRTVIPGSTWEEETRGTNAVGVAIRERRPAAIYGGEHYFTRYSELSCMASPICDPAGRVLGILDAACFHEGRQQHTHALVRMSAAQIENGLIYYEAQGTFIFAFHPRMEYLETLSAGLIAVSSDGEICSINHPGSALLSGLPAQMGGRFEDLFETAFGTAKDGMMQGGVICIKDKAGSDVFMVCRQIGTSSKPAASAETATRVQDADQPNFTCKEPSLEKQLDEMARAIRLQMPVHIFGETGTGKELMARHIHEVTGRKGEFVAVNCGAIPESLFIAELFGYVGGAFTDARREGSPGLVRNANNGTLFLDEIADIPLASQSALLRFLDTMQVLSVGGQEADTVDLQIVSATNADLLEMVDAGAFRADLLYRLCAYTISLPSLNDRTDFATIVRDLVEELAPGTAITDEAIASLAATQWPGNIRQLRSSLQRLVLRSSQTGYIDETDLEAGGKAVNDCCKACSENPLSRRRCRQIHEAYRANEHNISQTAKALGLSRTTVYKHLQH